MVRPDREVQLNLHLQDWERGDQHHHHLCDGLQHPPLIQVGVFVNSVPARVRMTVCDSGKLNFVNSSSGAENELSPYLIFVAGTTGSARVKKYLSSVKFSRLNAENCILNTFWGYLL